jgi:hypothetical protein
MSTPIHSGPINAPVGFLIASNLVLNQGVSVACPTLVQYYRFLGITLPLSPRSIPALLRAFTTAAMVPDCPRTGCASKASRRTIVVT